MANDIPQNLEPPVAVPVEDAPPKAGENEQKRKPRGFRIALIVVLLFLLVCAGALYFLPSFLPVDTIRSIAQSHARDYGLSVDFSRLGFSWDGRVVVEGVRVARLLDDGSQGDPLLTMNEVRTNVAVSPLLQGRIVVNSVEVNGFSARLAREADGSLNLPDFSKFAALPQPAARAHPERRHLLAAAAPAALPPVEIHQIDLNDGLIAVDDRVENLSLEIGLDFLKIQGGGLDDPLSLAGRLLPYPGAPARGEIPFTGRVAMLKNGALDPGGQATIEAEIKSFVLDELAANLGFGHLLKSGAVDGIVRAAYSEGRARLAVSEMRIAGAVVGLSPERELAVPDSTFGVDAEFDPEPGVLTFSDFSLLNDMNSLKANGWVRDAYNLANGLLPTAGVEFSGVADFARIIAFAETLGLDPLGLPELGGNGSYFGSAALAERESPDSAIPVTLSIDFNDGSLAAREPATGITANVELAGIGLKAAARVGETPELNANVSFMSVPIDAIVPQIGGNSVNLTANGGAALTVAGESVAAELRLRDARAGVPATPWAEAMNLVCPEARLTYNLQADRLEIAAMTFDINDGVKGGVRDAVVTGILAGDPRGQADIEVSTLLETVKTLFQPVMPEMAAKLAGSLRAAARVRMEGKLAEARVQAEIGDADVQLNLEPQAQAAVATPKTTIGILAAVNLDNPGALTIQLLEMNSAEAVLRVVEKGGNSLSGRFGVAAVKAAGVVDAVDMRGRFSTLSLTGNGMSVVIGQGAREIAGMESGVMQIVAATEEGPLTLPLTGVGEFNLPSLDAGVDNFVFYTLPADDSRQRRISDFGNIRAKLGVDGRLGDGGPRTINLRTGMFTAKPFAVNSRGQVDLGTGSLSLQYAARLIPAGMESLLSHLRLPPALLGQIASSGVLAWNGAQLDSKGNAQGQLRLASGDVNSFEMVHDFSAAYQPEQKSLAISVRRLDGNVKTASGETVATLAAQQSNLLLSRDGSKGFLDIRVNGSAGPTRQLALGLTGVLPQLRDIADTLSRTRVGGIYNAWLQVRDKDSSSIGVNLGGVWQGAALQFGDVPYLAEAGKLSAAVEGEFAYRENRIAVSSLTLRSDSAEAQGGGSAQALLAVDSERNITGVDNVDVDFRFVLRDLSKLPLAFPGVVPADMGMTGSVDGAFKAGGHAQDIRVSEGVARFQGVRLAPGGMDLTIQQGTANLDAVFSLASPAPASMAGTSYDAFRLFNVRDGRATLSGAQFQGQQVETAADFILDDGVLTLRNAQARVAGQNGGAIAAAGTVDFKPAAPAANIQLAIRNLPIAVINQEIEQYFIAESGVLNLPVAQDQSATVSFSGFSEDEILRTLRLGNFTFGTGPVVIHTGQLLNTELNKARGLMRQEVSDGDQSRRVTFQSITGTATAEGDGRLIIPAQNPIQIVGDNTGDFRVQGVVGADRTMNLEFLVVGKLENIIGFTLPNLIPNLRQGTDEEKSRFMQRMNRNAAAGHYAVKLAGPLENPDLSGIGQLALRFMTDIFAAAPGQIIGGVLDLGKDAPGALLDAAGAILNPENVIHPENIINAPRNLGRNIGRMFGVGGGGQTQPQGGATTGAR